VFGVNSKRQNIILIIKSNKMDKDLKKDSSHTDTKLAVIYRFIKPFELTLKIIIIDILITGLLYGVFSLIHFDYNCSHWHPMTNYGFFACWLFGLLFSVVLAKNDI